jgi:hypothetical protein
MKMKKNLIIMLIIFLVSCGTKEADVLFEDSRVTSGQSAWDEFVAQVENGESASIRLKFHYTENNVSYTQDLKYNGDTYILSDSDGIYKYKYMKKFDEENRYVLVNDETVTWDEIMRGMFSATSDAWIDHKTVYIDSK